MKTSLRNISFAIIVSVSCTIGVVFLVRSIDGMRGYQALLRLIDATEYFRLPLLRAAAYSVMLTLGCVCMLRFVLKNGRNIAIVRTRSRFQMLGALVGCTTALFVGAVLPGPPWYLVHVVIGLICGTVSAVAIHPERHAPSA